MRVFYDPVPDQIWIEGQPQSFARRSLWASLEDGNKIGIRMLNAGPDELLVKAAFGNIRDRSGAVFASPADVKAYLDAEFAKAHQNNALTLTMTAAAPLGGHRVVRSGPSGLAIYASADDVSTLGAVTGISPRSAEAGAPLDVVVAGEMVEPSWSWGIGPVWLGLNGAITQVAPSTGLDQQVGIAIAPNRLIVDIAPAILLAQ